MILSKDADSYGDGHKSNDKKLLIMRCYSSGLFIMSEYTYVGQLAPQINDDWNRFIKSGRKVKEIYHLISSHDGSVF